MSKQWKAITGDWTFIQSQQDTGTLLCLTRQERSTLQTFLMTAYWPTRWSNAPSRDTLDAFISQLELKLMEDCTLSLVQVGCTLQLLLNGAVISSMPFNADACALLGGSDGAGGGWYELPVVSETTEDKKTELFSGAMALVKFCSEAVIDFFSAIDAEIELGKACVAWMEAVPLLDLSPAYEILETADALNSMLRSAFLAGDTPDWREQEACRIMCWCVNNDYTFDKSVIDLWRVWLLGKILLYPEQGYFHFVALAEYRTLLNRFALGMNDDDEDWLILCDACAPACGVLTFDDEETDIDYVIDFGTLVDNGNPDNCVNSAYYEGVPELPIGEKLIVTLELAQVSSVTMITWDAYIEKPSGAGPNVGRIIEFLNAAEEVFDTWQETAQPVEDEWYQDQWDDDPVDGVSFVRLTIWWESGAVGNHLARADNIGLYCTDG